MVFKIKPLLLKCDFIGFIPQFRIMDDIRYKSIFSSLLSIILIVFFIAFASYSFIEYVHQIPKIEYYKNNDYGTNKTFTISNSLFMFKYDFFCSSNNSEEHTLKFALNELKDEKLFEYIEFEPCELGKNIDIKYKDVIEKFESIEGDKIDEYFCLNFTGKEFTLYSNPNIRNMFEKYLSLQLQ